MVRFLFYGGEGGVGKTMCAAARAVIDASRGARVLVASTDSAHSLGDALGVRLSRSPRAIAAAPVRAASAKTRRAGGRPRGSTRWS